MPGPAERKSWSAISTDRKVRKMRPFIKRRFFGAARRRGDASFHAVFQPGREQQCAWRISALTVNGVARTATKRKRDLLYCMRETLLAELSDIREANRQLDRLIELIRAEMGHG